MTLFAEYNCRRSNDAACIHLNTDHWAGISRERILQYFSPHNTEKKRSVHMNKIIVQATAVTLTLASSCFGWAHRKASSCKFEIKFDRVKCPFQSFNSIIIVHKIEVWENTSDWENFNFGITYLLYDSYFANSNDINIAFKWSKQEKTSSKSLK